MTQRRKVRTPSASTLVTWCLAMTCCAAQVGRVAARFGDKQVASSSAHDHLGAASDSSEAPLGFFGDADDADEAITDAFNRTASIELDALVGNPYALLWRRMHDQRHHHLSKGILNGNHKRATSSVLSSQTSTSICERPASPVISRPEPGLIIAMSRSAITVAER